MAELSSPFTIAGDRSKKSHIDNLLILGTLPLPIVQYLNIIIDINGIKIKKKHAPFVVIELNQT